MVGEVFLNKEIHELAGWFRHNRLAKVLVLVLFLGLGIGISLTIRYASIGFFTLLSTYSQFGELIVQYSFQSGMIVYILLGGILGIFPLLAAVNGQTGRQVHISRKPVEHYFVYQVVKSTIGQVVLLGLIMLPLIQGLVMGFGISISFLSLLLLVASLLILPQAVSLLAVPWLLWMKTWKYRWAQMIVWVGAGSLLLVLGRYLFPKQLFWLSATPDVETFMQVFSGLPLNRIPLPTHGISEMIISGRLLPGILPLVGGIAVFFVGLYLSEWALKRLGGTLAQSHQAPLIVAGRFTWPRGLVRGILQKELLGIMRLRQEQVYYLIMLGLSVTFVWLVRMILTSRVTYESYTGMVAVMTSIVTGYLMAVVANRFVYPLFSKEAKKGWIYLTKAVNGIQVLDAKIGTTLVLGLPWLVLPILIGTFLALDVPVVLALVFLMVSQNLLILFIHFFMGLLFPNVEAEGDGDKASTSVGGLLSLGLTIGLMILTAQSIWALVSDHLVVSFVPVMAGASLVLALAYVSIQRINRGLGVQ
jgi:hypothetical protein